MLLLKKTFYLMIQKMMKKIQIMGIIQREVVELMGLCDLMIRGLHTHIHLYLLEWNIDDSIHHIQLNNIYEMMIYEMGHLACLILMEKLHLKLL